MSKRDPPEGPESASKRSCRAAKMKVCSHLRRQPASHVGVFTFLAARNPLTGYAKGLCHAKELCGVGPLLYLAECGGQPFYICTVGKRFVSGPRSRQMGRPVGDFSRNGRMSVLGCWGGLIPGRLPCLSTLCPEVQSLPEADWLHACAQLDTGALVFHAHMHNVITWAWRLCST